MNSRMLDINQEHDMYMILELVGYEDSNKIEYVMGEKQDSIFKMIQR